MTPFSLDDARKQLKVCIANGAVERPPVQGQVYAAFAVYPPVPGLLAAFAIVHREGEQRVQDVIRQNISVADAGALMDRYGISAIHGDESEGDGDDLLHATAGAFHMLGGVSQ